MDHTTRDERSIEDYLFDGYRPSTYTDSIDNQQFAQSIEDEDFFGSTGEDLRSTGASTISHNKPAAKSKLMQLKQKIKEQALAKGLTPKFTPDHDGMIEIEIEKPIFEPESKAKAIFERSKNRVRDKYGLYKGQKLHWCRYNRYLQNTISSQKRKQWDSFQHPPDRYDDEEELIEGYDEDSIINPDEEEEIAEEGPEEKPTAPKRNRIDDDSDSGSDQEAELDDADVSENESNLEPSKDSGSDPNEDDDEPSASDEDPLASGESDFDDD